MVMGLGTSTPFPMFVSPGVPSKEKNPRRVQDRGEDEMLKQPGAVPELGL